MPIEISLSAHPRAGLTVHRFDDALDLGVDAFITDRFGGVSTGAFDSLNLGDHVGDNPELVAENRRRVARAIDVDLEGLTIVRQVHGAKVINAASATPTSEADAMYSDDSNVALAILVADCVPLLLVDTTSERIALVHAGWRGLHSGVIKSTVEVFPTPSSLHAFIGPSISRETYQVGTDVAQYFADVDDALSPDGERFRLDLRRVATRQLCAAGIKEEHVFQSVQVTDGGEMFFSDRHLRPCGRFALVAKRVS